MANNKDNNTKIETIRGIGSGFGIDENIIKGRNKKINLDITSNELGNEDFIEKLDISQFNKSFKVGNNNTKGTSDIIGKMQIEIEGIPIKDDKDFGKQLHHYFK